MWYQMFADSDFEKYFEKSVGRQYMCDTVIDKYLHGVIVNEHRHGFGVFDAGFHFVRSSRQMRKNNGQFIPNFNHTEIPYVDEDVVFIGNVFPQFGHFLLEHMNRAYALLDKKYRNMKVVLINNRDINPVPKYMLELLNLLGIPNENIIILDKTTQFRSVYVPSQGFNIPVYSSVAFGKMYDAIAKAVKSPKITYDKIYVSRTAMHERRTYGEEQVQKIFERNGYKIICPETLPLQEQIGLVKNCKYLAGCAGTALHLALFMNPGGTVIQIKRNRLPKCNADIQNLINDTKKLNGIFISGSIETLPTDHCSSVPQIIGINKHMCDFFDAYDFAYDEKDLVINEQDYADYKRGLEKYNKEYGGVKLNGIKHFIIHYSSCLIIGRERRGNYRRWLKSKLKYEG